MSGNEAQEKVIFTVLFVDDEPNILRAIKRALFTLDINLLLARRACGYFRHEDATDVGG